VRFLRFAFRRFAPRLLQVRFVCAFITIHTTPFGLPSIPWFYTATSPRVPGLPVPQSRFTVGFYPAYSWLGSYHTSSLVPLVRFGSLFWFPVLYPCYGFRVDYLRPFGLLPLPIWITFVPVGSPHGFTFRSRMPVVLPVAFARLVHTQLVVPTVTLQFICRIRGCVLGSAIPVTFCHGYRGSARFGLPDSGCGWHGLVIYCRLRLRSWFPRPGSPFPATPFPVCGSGLPPYVCYLPCLVDFALIVVPHCLPSARLRCCLRGLPTPRTGYYHTVLIYVVPFCLVLPVHGYWFRLTLTPGFPRFVLPTAFSSLVQFGLPASFTVVCYIIGSCLVTHAPPHTPHTTCTHHLPRLHTCAMVFCDMWTYSDRSRGLFIQAGVMQTFVTQNNASLACGLYNSPSATAILPVALYGNAVNNTYSRTVPHGATLSFSFHSRSFSTISSRHRAHNSCLPPYSYDMLIPTARDMLSPAYSCSLTACLNMRNPCHTANNMRNISLTQCRGNNRPFINIAVAVQRFRTTAHDSRYARLPLPSVCNGSGSPRRDLLCTG